MPTNKPINLSEMIQDEIRSLGDKAPSFFGASESTIRKWASGTVPPTVAAAQKCLNKLILANGGSLPAGAAPSETASSAQPKEAEMPAFYAELVSVFGARIDQAPRWLESIADRGGVMIRVIAAELQNDVVFAPYEPGASPVGSAVKTASVDEVAGVANATQAAQVDPLEDTGDQLVEDPPVVDKVEGDQPVEFPEFFAIPKPGPGAPAESKASEKEGRFQILLPTNRPYNPFVMLSILANWQATLPEPIREQLAKLHLEKDTTPHHSRNLLATAFLKSKAEWSYWQDSDIIAPTGNPNWFKRRLPKAGAEKIHNDHLATAAIEQLSSHRKTIVSAIYAERGGRNRLVSSLDITDSEDKRRQSGELRKRSKKGLIEVKWAGFGCIVVHRSVFEDILKKFPEIESKNEGRPHGFFTAREQVSGPSSEDIAFCSRAAAAGHKTWLDTSVWCAHVGEYAYLP